MPFYIGENKIVDRYIGDKLVIAAYKGESKYFDAYSEKVYGWHVGPSVSNPDDAITYLGDAVGKTPAAMGSETF
jgi:hypothetical protein